MYAYVYMYVNVCVLKYIWIYVVLYKLSGLERLVKKTLASKPELLLSLQSSGVTEWSTSI